MSEQIVEELDKLEVSTGVQVGTSQIARHYIRNLCIKIQCNSDNKVI